MRCLLVILLLLSACGGGELTRVNYFEGREGIHTEFGPNTPPRTLYEDSSFMIGINMHNKGAFDTSGELMVEYDTFVFKEPEPSSFWEPSTSRQGVIVQEFSLRGKQPDFPRGEMGFVEGGFLEVREVDGLRESTTTRITASVCYPYRTQLTDFFCIDSDVFGIGQNAVCRARPYHTYSGQGAPVIIDRVTPDVIPRGSARDTQETIIPVLDETGNLVEVRREEVDTRQIILQPHFEISIRNVGRGLVFGTDDGLSACTDANQRTMGQVHVSANMLDLNLTCSPNPVIIRGGEATTRCFVEPDDWFYTSTSYMDVLTVYLDYYYLDQTSTEVRVNRLRR